MRKTSLGLAIIAVLALGGAAVAQPDGNWKRECFGPGPLSMEEAQQGCVKFEPSTAADRLRTLKDLLDQGLISQEEYQARRRAALDRL